MTTPVQVDIYRAPLDVPAEEQASLRAILTPEELHRVDRIRIEKPRTQYLVARSILRRILGKYLDLPPQHVRLQLGRHGKPYLEPAANPIDLRFNLSHSHGQVIYAVTTGCDLGIDIEKARPEVRCEDLAQRFFSNREADKLMSLPEDQRVNAFFTCWTRKEAFIKAKGTGLHTPLNHFDVAFAPGETPALLHTEWNPAEAPQWRIEPLTAPPGYIAALAVRCQSITIRNAQL